MNFCICQMIKDEHQYIEEWIEYHHNLGVNRFYLIEDYCSSSHNEILKKYNYVELYKLTDIMNNDEQILFNDKSYYRQKIVYNIFERLWKNKNDWCAFIDVDEYIFCDKQILLNTLNDNQYKIPYISIIWLYMKCDGHIYHPNKGKKYSLIDTYKTYLCKNDFRKQIINCNEKFNDLTSIQQFTGFPHRFKEIYNFDNIKLKHFLHKSFEEWIYRLQYKGEIITANWNRKIDDWFIVNYEYKDMKETLYQKFNLYDNFKYLKNDIK